MPTYAIVFDMLGSGSQHMNNLQRLTLAVTTALASNLLVVNAPVYAQSAKQDLDDSCWTLSFDEPFDSLSLRNSDDGTGRWHTRYIWARDTIINNEQQYYVDPSENEYSPFSIDAGVLTIEAIPTPRALRGDVSGQPYVSGVLTTEKTFSQHYGRFEARAQLPAGQGLWSAFWLLPSFDQWPSGVAVLPEIDVMEHLGHQKNTYHTTLHTNQSGSLSSYPYDHTGADDLTQGFHLYSVVWTPESVRWYLDGVWQAEHSTPRDYTRPVHFLLNLAVGGNWPGSPDGSTEFPAHFDVDYVRAWTDNKQCRTTTD